MGLALSAFPFAGHALALQKPAPDDAIVIRPEEKKAA
jgi:hypothetical protein